MEIDYYSKYLKYKSKYLELKKQMGGGRCTGISFNKENINCVNYTRTIPNRTIPNRTPPNRQPYMIEPYPEDCNIPCKCTKFVLQTDNIHICNTCGHIEKMHIK